MEGKLAPVASSEVHPRAAASILNRWKTQQDRCEIQRSVAGPRLPRHVGAALDRVALQHTAVALDTRRGARL